MIDIIPQPAYPQRYSDGRLTLEGMRAILAEGGSVMYEGKILTDPSKLPPPPSNVAILIRIIGSCHSLGTVEYSR